MLHTTLFSIKFWGKNIKKNEQQPIVAFRPVPTRSFIKTRVELSGPGQNRVRTQTRCFEAAGRTHSGLMPVFIYESPVFLTFCESSRDCLRFSPGSIAATLRLISVLRAFLAALSAAISRSRPVHRGF